MKTHPILLLISAAIGLGVVGGLYLITYFKYSANPKYIGWDKNGILIIDQRNKKECIRWKQIKEIFKLGKYSKLNKDSNEYCMYIKGKMYPRHLNERIGREIKEYYEKRKWTNSKE